MIDSDFNTWLIEVNTNPCLEESSALLKMYIPRMVDDAFKLTIDEIFQPIKKFQNELAVFHVDKYADNENMWEKMGNLGESQPIESTSLRSKHIFFTNSTMCFKIKEFNPKAKNEPKSNKRSRVYFLKNSRGLILKNSKTATTFFASA